MFGNNSRGNGYRNPLEKKNATLEIEQNSTHGMIKIRNFLIDFHSYNMYFCTGQQRKDEEISILQSLQISGGVELSGADEAGVCTLQKII